MQESDDYIGVLEEGREIQARHMLRQAARRTLGEPDEQSITLLEGITDLERLERIYDRALDAKATSWQDLLSTP